MGKGKKRQERRNKAQQRVDLSKQQKSVLQTLTDTYGLRYPDLLADGTLDDIAYSVGYNLSEAESIILKMTSPEEDLLQFEEEHDQGMFGTVSIADYVSKAI